MGDTQKIIIVMMAIGASGVFGWILGQAYGDWRARQAVLKYYQDKPMSLLEEAVNYLYLTIRK